MAWRNCSASMTLVSEVNSRWPSRNRMSDGTVGDLSHQARPSDHNPNAAGVVRARDITASGIDTAWLCEHLRILGRAGDPRLANGGYLIFNRRITNPDFKTWRVYTGSNPHVSHMHVSFTRTPAGYDSTASWGIDTPMPDTEEGEDLTPDEARMLREVHAELTKRHPNRVDFRFLGEPEPASRVTESIAGMTINADARAYEARQLSRQALLAYTSLNAKLDQLITLVKAAGVDPTAVQNAVAAALGGGLVIAGTAVPKRP